MHLPTTKVSVAHSCVLWVYSVCFETTEVKGKVTEVLKSKLTTIISKVS